MDLQKIMMEPTTTLVDVRTSGEFMRGSIEGAVNIPLSEIVKEMETFKSMPGKIIVFCRSGMRSGQAMGFLRAYGMTEVYNGGGVHDMEYLKKKVA